MTRKKGNDYFVFRRRVRYEKCSSGGSILSVIFELSIVVNKMNRKIW